MARSNEFDEQRARELLREQHIAPDLLSEMKGLERRLAKAGDHELAVDIRRKREPADKALAIAALAGTTLTSKQMLELAKRLGDYKQFGTARRLLRLASKDVKRTADPKIYSQIFQRSALYTYKDPDLPAEWRLVRALEILGTVEDLNVTTDAETLGLAGAIHKRLWEVRGQRTHLDRSLFFYLKGYAQGGPEACRGDVLDFLRRTPGCVMVAKDQGYCAINAAFLLDVIAQMEDQQSTQAGLVSHSGAQRREDARLIREEIVRSVPPTKDPRGNEWLQDEWWFYATVGEAFFGLGSFKEAVRWLVEAPEAAGLKVPSGYKEPAGLDVPEWEYESTARQLARLARVRLPPQVSEADFERTPVGEVLRQFLRGDQSAVASAFRGKLGLGLSGGGFRAALFHIGVLARLAEVDLLRHVEVLSCVSGGSIVGAHYYLKLRKLFETTADGAITTEDYVRIVQETEREFLQGVQRNIRTRVLAELTTNLKMAFWPGYSRTLRVGELYEREIFSLAGDTAGPMKTPHWLNELFVHPKLADGNHQTGFNPRNDNWRRNNKVPVLILNASTLNTGHNWQFTARFMGEPPTPINAEIDSNDRLRRMYYEDAPDKYKRIRLGHAVAASSCVPGLFEPLNFEGLYPGRTVRLVDGGVCDNQGVASLNEQDCTSLVISDGSGQMESQDVPSGGILGVPLRSNGILQARVREAQYNDVNARRRASLLRGLGFVHLKQDLPGKAVAWNQCPPELKESDERQPDRERDRTEYGVDISIQEKLAAIRTDLDSFSDAEAYALMFSGYQATAKQLDTRETGLRPFMQQEKRAKWSFLSIAPAMEPRGEATVHLKTLLDAGSKQAFRIWRLWLPLKLLAGVLAAAAVLGIVYAAYQWRAASILSPDSWEWAQRTLIVGNVARWGFGLGGLALLGIVVRVAVGARLGKHVMRAVRWRENLQALAIGLAMSLVGFLIARLHLGVFDRLFLWHGRLERFPAHRSTPAPNRQVPSDPRMAV